MTTTPLPPTSTSTSDLTSRSDEEVRGIVKETYGRVAARSSSCCGGGEPLVSIGAAGARQVAERIGYSAAEIEAVPEGANLGLGCGNPTAIAGLAAGEVVVDLGAGAGFDALLAAKAVGPSGRVIGVDMTPEMLGKARTNAVEAGVAGTVEFREGIIESLPIVSGTADVVISNCVINLSPDKPQVFREAFRVLKPGGRLAVSDIVLSEPLPPAIAALAEAWTACVAGALLEKDYVGAIEAAGFVNVRVARTSMLPLLESFSDDPRARAAIASLGEDAIRHAVGAVWSVRVEADKPRGSA